jgi:anionic cell wall polymer biosynthesis LytR-Cps2A-Psr (LCP) family protein
MNGQQALAFSRNRHIPNGDLNRTLHQGHLILSALTELRKRGTSAGDTVRSLSVLLRHTRFDGLSTIDVYRLGRLGLSIDPAQMRNVVMPGRIGMVGSQSVVLVRTAEATSLFRDFADDAILQAH